MAPTAIFVLPPNRAPGNRSPIRTNVQTSSSCAAEHVFDAKHGDEREDVIVRSHGDKHQKSLLSGSRGRVCRSVINHASC